MRDIFELIDNLPLTEEPQVLPTNFDAVAPEKRQEYLRTFAVLPLDFTQVAWDDVGGVPIDETEARLGMDRMKILKIREEIEYFKSKVVSRKSHERH